MSDFLDRLLTCVAILGAAYLYSRSAPRSFASVISLVVLVAWGARFVLAVVLT